MNELALFAGAGGGILGGVLLGWRTVCAVEIEPYAASVLVARQNDGILPAFPVWDDVCTFDGRPWRGLIDVVSGGFPCQDISAAGSGKGLDGSKSGLWREMARIIGEVRPRYVFLENSPMLVGRGLGRILADLAEIGFDAGWTCLSAAECGAPHVRDRIWLLAHAHDDKAERWEQQQAGGKGKRHVADTDRDGGKGLEQKPQPGEHGRPSGLHDRAGSAPVCDTWPPEPGVGRVAHGVAARLDRIKALGNGQVPRVAATAFRMLAERIAA